MIRYPVPPVDIDVAESLLAQMERRGVGYGLGAKAPEHPFFRDPEAPIDSIRAIDCSGWVRLAFYRATKGALLLPDGSQNMRAWFELKAEAELLREVEYVNAARYMTERRLFIAFIKPFTNGCSKVGHVWLVSQMDGQAVTLESHGGTGVDSRAWDSRTLKREVYSCFELPTR